MSELDALARAYGDAGGDPAVLHARNAARLVVSGSNVLAAHAVPGIELQAEDRPNGVEAVIRVLPGTRLADSVHLCFGVLPSHGVQEIVARYDVGPDSDVTFLAHCTFPNAVKVRHVMDARLRIGERATLRYLEAHFHGRTGGAEVLPTAVVALEPGARFLTTFSLTHGRAGTLALDYGVDLAEGGVADLTTRVMGSGTDRIKITETVRLNGAGARGIVKARVALSGEARGEVIGNTEGNAAETRGHIDCVEVVRDRVVVEVGPELCRAFMDNPDAMAGVMAACPGGPGNPEGRRHMWSMMERMMRTMSGG